MSFNPGCRSAIRANCGRNPSASRATGNAALLRRRPQPVERAVVEPRLLVRLQERVSQAAHAGLAGPGRESFQAIGVVRLDAAQNRELVRVASCGLGGERVRIRIPVGRMDDRAVHPGGVHLVDRFLDAERLGAMRRNDDRMLLCPEMNLGVDDLHVVRSRLGGGRPNEGGRSFRKSGRSVGDLYRGEPRARFSHDAHRSSRLRDSRSAGRPRNGRPTCGGAPGVGSAPRKLAAFRPCRPVAILILRRDD